MTRRWCSTRRSCRASTTTTSEGVTITDDTTASGQRKLTSFDAGDWIAYDPVSFTGITGVQTRAAGAGTLALRWNAPDAAPFATVSVPAGDGWQTRDHRADRGADRQRTSSIVTSSGGVELDSLTFKGAGVADKTAPKVTATLNPAQPTGSNGWYTGNVSLSVSATDNGTVSSRQYSVNGGTTWLSANAAVTLSTEGTTTVQYRATDSGGNISEVGTLTVRIDKTGPAVTFAGLDADGTYGDSKRPDTGDHHHRRGVRRGHRHPRHWTARASAPDSRWSCGDWRSAATT